jgi:AraC family transcriptional regulator
MPVASLSPAAMPAAVSLGIEDHGVGLDVRPDALVMRRLAQVQGVIVEVVEAMRPGRVDFRFDGSRHLVAIHVEGLRRQGETLINGLRLSTLRDMKRKIVFVPAGNDYHDWHEPLALGRFIFFYFEQTPSSDKPASKLIFEDSALFALATKLAGHMEKSGVLDAPYLEAFCTVLAHELRRLGDHPPAEVSRSKGGLASWQFRKAANYIEENLAQAIPLEALARQVGLSSYHFCRAFKQSLGMPPRRYQCHRRIEHARRLLENPEVSVAEIARIVGYSDTSSFTATFRKILGLTPTAYRRNLPPHAAPMTQRV